MEKLHKNTEENKQYILKVVTAFYQKAVGDFIIGYHFRKIATSKGDHPLQPPIEAFADHIPRIALFWRMQLLGETKPADTEPFDLIGIHQKLSLRKGEVGRWIMLFKETLHDHQHDLNTAWLLKIEQFEKIFYHRLFNHKEGDEA